MARTKEERIKAIVYTFHPEGPDGPATHEPGVSGFTTDEALLALFASEVERHVWLHLAELTGDPVPDHPAATLVECKGLGAPPWRKLKNIGVEAIACRLREPADVISYRVWSIRTAHGRLLRETGASRKLADQTAATIRRELDRDEVTEPWGGTFAPGILPSTEGPASFWPRRVA